jgi:hypothetical protein
MLRTAECMSKGKMAIGGIGTAVIALIVLLLGGDPTTVIDSMQNTRLKQVQQLF